MNEPKIIVPAFAPDRELAGINQATCKHEWVPNTLYRLLGDGTRYYQYTHCCARCLLCGNAPKMIN